MDQRICRTSNRAVTFPKARSGSGSAEASVESRREGPSEQLLLEWSGRVVIHQEFDVGDCRQSPKITRSYNFMCRTERVLCWRVFLSLLRFETRSIRSCLLTLLQVDRETWDMGGFPWSVPNNTGINPSCEQDTHQMAKAQPQIRKDPKHEFFEKRFVRFAKALTPLPTAYFVALLSALSTFPVPKDLHQNLHEMEVSFSRIKAGTANIQARLASTAPLWLGAPILISKQTSGTVMNFT